MMEYQAVIKIGRATLKVLFTDGSMTAMGQNPAQFTTTDFLTQHAIESCSDYKRGLIKKVSIIDLEEDVRIERNVRVKTAKQAPAGTETAKTEKEDNASRTKAAETEAAVEKVEEEETGTAQDEDTAAEEMTADDSGSDDGNELTEVEFGTNQEAKDYLTKTFGVKSSMMKNRADIVAAGEANGVKIIFATE